MKKVLLVAMMLCSIAFAQDCKYKVNEVDDFTGSVKKITKFEPVGKSDVGILKASVIRVGEVYAVTFQFSADLECLSSDSYALVKFTDGTTLNINNIASIDCGDNPTFIGSITKDSFLRSKTIDKIRLKYDYYTDVLITNQSFLIEGLKCVE